MSGFEIAGAATKVEIQRRPTRVTLDAPGRVTLTGGRGDDPIRFRIGDETRGREWVFRIMNPKGDRVHFERGRTLPEALTWKPRVRGRPPAAGRYRAVLAYRDEAGIQTESEASFRIAYAAFDASIAAAPTLFTPAARGGRAVEFKIRVTGELKPSRWRLGVVPRGGRQPIRLFQGQGAPPASLAWDGRARGGEPVAGGSVHVAVLTLQSSVGTTVRAETEPIQADLGAVGGEAALSINLVRVRFAEAGGGLDEDARRALAEAAGVIRRYKTDYVIRVLGHAARGEDEAAELSRRRAAAVKTYLQERENIPADRIQAVGYGAAKAGGDDRKDRRVEVVLIAK